jgi:catechol 2,3-dioxygenase-like lactoylglutathione lyase family enzyme
MKSSHDQMVPILRVANAETAATWYSRLGFVLEGIHRFEPTFPAYAFVKREDTYLHLSEHRGDAPVHGVVYWYVSRPMLEAFAAEFGVTIERQPWCDEIHLTDPDGNRLRIGCRNDEHDAGFEPNRAISSS